MVLRALQFIHMHDKEQNQRNNKLQNHSDLEGDFLGDIFIYTYLYFTT